MFLFTEWVPRLNMRGRDKPAPSATRGPSVAMAAGTLLVGLGISLAPPSALSTTDDSPPIASSTLDPAKIERGRYLAQITGCNDCHTEGYAESGGNVPESRWLAGSDLGWRGPWGTTYAANLRQLMANLSEDQWVNFARNLRARPPMPWFQLRDMNDGDLRSLHHFVVSLGPDNASVPKFVPPEQEPVPPFVVFPVAPAQ